MKKILSLAFVLGFCQLALANDIEDTKTQIKSNDDSASPVACCTRRASSGVYGSAGYNQVIVKTCATSDTSYQDAQARACSKADVMADAALKIAEATLSPVAIP